MDQWYYAEGNRQRVGPLPTENVVELYRSGRIARDTLVWREGLPQWQPLGDFAVELGLSPAIPTHDGAPPPLPAGSPAAPVAAAVPAPRQGMSGCSIAVIVAVVVGLAGVAVLGILAAIAIPAYQEYVLKSKVAMGYDHIAALRTQVVAFQASEGHCPVNGEGNLGTPESYAGQGIGSVRIGRFDNAHCGIEAQFQGTGSPKLDGKALWLDLDPESGRWRCSSEIEDRYLSTECRG